MFDTISSFRYQFGHEEPRHAPARHVGPGDAPPEGCSGRAGGDVLGRSSPRVFGISRQSVNVWEQRRREGGLRAVRSRPRGRPRILELKPYQAAITVRLITDRCPDQLKLPFVLWAREAVQEVIAR